MKRYSILRLILLRIWLFIEHLYLSFYSLFSSISLFFSLTVLIHYSLVIYFFEKFYSVWFYSGWRLIRMYVLLHIELTYFLSFTFSIPSLLFLEESYLRIMQHILSLIGIKMKPLGNNTTKILNFWINPGINLIIIILPPIFITNIQIILFIHMDLIMRVCVDLRLNISGIIHIYFIILFIFCIL